MLKDFTINPAMLETMPRKQIEFMLRVGNAGLKGVWKVSKKDRAIIQGKLDALQTELTRRDTFAERELLPSIRGEKRRRK